MDLKEFVEQSINQIIEGVTNARTQNEGKATISMTLTSSGSTLVEFDVAVTASDVKNKEAKGKVKVFSVIDVGGGVNNEVLNKSYSRIKFSIHIKA